MKPDFKNIKIMNKFVKLHLNNNYNYVFFLSLKNI